MKKKPINYYKRRNSIHWKYRVGRKAVNEPEPSLEKLGILRASRYTWRNSKNVGFAYLVMGFSGAILPYLAMVGIIIVLILLYIIQIKNMLNLKPQLPISIILSIIYLISIYWMIGHVLNPYM